MNPLLLRRMRETGGILYLASPYTGYRPKHADETFNDLLEEAALRAAYASGELHALGIPHFCPIAHSHWTARARGIDPRDHGLWMPHCVAHLERCSGVIILMLPGWRESIGVNEERRINRDLDRPELHMAPPDVRI